MGCHNTDCSGGCNCTCTTRYTGPEIECLGVSEGDSFETVISTIAQYVCNIQVDDGVGIEDISYDPDTGIVTVTTTDGTIYQTGDLRGEGVDHVSFTSSTGGGGAGQPGQTDTYTVWGDLSETINLGTFLVYNGIDGINANSNYGNTVFVDAVYGDNVTGTRERFDLPFLDIASAMSVALPGDNVWVRSGTYTEDLILQDNVDVFFESVQLNGKITDNGVALKSKVRGGLSIVYGSNDAIEAIGPGSDISVDLKEINSTGNSILADSNQEIETKLSVKVESIYNSEINYFISARGNSRLYVDILRSARTKDVTSDIAGFTAIELRNNFRGIIEFNCPYIFVGQTELTNGGILYNEDASTTDATVILNIGRFETTYNNPSPTERATINKKGASKAFMNIGRLECITRDGIHVIGDKPGYLYYSGRVVSQEGIAMRYSSNQKTIFKGSSLKRGNGGSDDNYVVVVGSPGLVPALTDGIETGYALEIADTEIIKESSGTDTTGAMVYKTGEPTINIKNSELYGYGTFSGGAVSTDGGPNTNIYFKNVNGNASLDALNVTDTSASGGNYTQDPSMDLFDYVD
jgi:hypothetical protein